MEIPKITIPNAQVRSLDIPNIQIWTTDVHNPVPPVVPVVVNIGKPIVDMPGCVEVHELNDTDRFTSTKNKKLAEDDDTVTYCDASLPSYTAMDYEPEQLTITQDIPPPKVEPPPDPEIETPETPSIPKTDEEVPCPGPTSLRIGAVGPNEKEKVVGHELQKNPQGKLICVELYEDIGIAEQYLPSAQVAATTATIATVAGASALLAKPLADLLLRVFRPAIKQVLTKVNAILGKTPYRPTQAEIRTNEYRKKKGLVGINFAKTRKKEGKKK